MPTTVTFYICWFQQSFSSLLVLIYPLDYKVSIQKLMDALENAYITDNQKQEVILREYHQQFYANKPNVLINYTNSKKVTHYENWVQEETAN